MCLQPRRMVLKLLFLYTQIMCLREEKPRTMYTIAEIIWFPFSVLYFMSVLPNSQYLTSCSFQWSVFLYFKKHVSCIHFKIRMIISFTKYPITTTNIKSPSTNRSHTVISLSEGKETLQIKGASVTTRVTSGFAQEQGFPGIPYVFLFQFCCPGILEHHCWSIQTVSEKLKPKG